MHLRGQEDGGYTRKEKKKQEKEGGRIQKKKEKAQENNRKEYQQWRLSPLSRPVKKNCKNHIFRFFSFHFLGRFEKTCLIRPFGPLPKKVFRSIAKIALGSYSVTLCESFANKPQVHAQSVKKKLLNTFKSLIPCP